jgi:peptidylprolyl isomerase domain and WD repeat-containing protein 1
VVNFDMMAMLRLPYTPSAVEWVFKKGEAQVRLAIADKDSADVHIYDAKSGSNDPIETMKVR